jgi:hypothetical protein
MTMSKLTALLTTVALGATASIAAASPAQTYDRRTGVTYIERGSQARRYDVPVRYDNRFIDRSYDRSYGRHDGRTWGPHGAADDFGPRHYRTTWVPLSDSQRIRGGLAFDVNDAGTFTQLRLQTEAGTARVDRLIVLFADGSDQVVNLDRALTGYVDIPLDGNNRRIERILVTGASGRGGLQVFAI